MNKNEPISADFVDIKTVPTRSLLRLMFDVNLEDADTVLKALGGIPLPGENRICCIVLMGAE